MNKTSRIAAFAITLLVPTALVAQAPALPSFEEVDKNRDGSLSQAEVRKYVDKRSRDIDFNRNGRLDPVEIADAVSSMNARQAANYIDLMDRDGDNELSYDEMAQDMPMLFGMADTDSDDLISLEEYVSILAHYGH
jgi:Ca2+-binding EF-hand superfamily protein